MKDVYTMCMNMCYVYVLLYISCEGKCYIYMYLISDVGGDWGEVINSNKY